MDNGWIKLHRKILESDMYKDLTSKQFHILTVLLMMANHKDKRWSYKGEIYTASAGQMVTSLENIRKNCTKDVSIKAIRCAIEKLEKWGFAAKKGTKTGMVITIVNWELYQGDEDERGKEKGREGAEKGQLTRMIKNDKEKRINTSAQKKSASKTYADDSVEMNLAMKLLTTIQEWHPEYKAKNIHRWCDDFRKLLSLGNQSLEQVEKVIAWLPGSEFWRKNILSAAALRKHFDRLYAQMISENKKVIPMPRTDSDDEFMLNTKLMYQWIDEGNDPEDMEAFRAWKKKLGETMNDRTRKFNYRI